MSADVGGAFRGAIAMLALKDSSLLAFQERALEPSRKHRSKDFLVLLRFPAIR